MRTVAVDLDSCLRLILAVGVSSDVVAAVQNGHFQAQLGGGAFRDGQAEETRADDDEISVHKLSCMVACGHSNAHVYWSRLPDQRSFGRTMIRQDVSLRNGTELRPVSSSRQ